MAATVVPRPPLGLPPGSIRGLLALQIVIIFWVLLAGAGRTCHVRSR